VSDAVRPAELFAALSLATDLGSGLPLEHALQTCLLAVRLAQAGGASRVERETTHYVALLHAIGCTSNAHETAALFGDDVATRAAWATIDPGRQRDVLRFVVSRAGAGAPVGARLRALAEVLGAGPAGPRENFAAHCEVAVRLAARLGLPTAVQDGLRHAFERFDGRGFPGGVGGEAIPPSARLLHVARDAHAIVLASGVTAALAAVGERGAYDPAIAGLLTRDMLEPAGDAWDAVVAAAPAGPALTGDALDEACAVAGDFADMKSPWTLGHSAGVAELAEAAAWRLGLDDIPAVRRAALLHDLGRVAISSSVWDKPGPLSGADRERVRLHPYYTDRTLARCPGLAALGRLGAAHHERLDGSGYHRGCGAAELSVAARVIAAADAFHAMTETRPHRPALDADAAAAQLTAEARAGRLDSSSVEAVLAAAGVVFERVRPPLPGGLTEREAEVLGLIARGLTNKQVAERLGTATKTVGNQVQAVYAKIGVSTRAAAALFASEHGLLPRA
jgi:HD-GYP domain-containing protein (c-di-GMP phosphodiesterase class II)/DNA-binding CsgD family transcriptional regulator